MEQYIEFTGQELSLEIQVWIIITDKILNWCNYWMFVFMINVHYNCKVARKQWDGKVEKR